ncbi:putative Ig domain-containing protein [Chamaesiphon polymorphus]|uniref:putative Ig domain-containing protein n=1 Tax=Chamaesiphon polymorphus TaxID=2107691 RepID=UPI001C634A14|nr:putative Ig domain-containing protein [Chamaesiphon polymorphus]
MNVALKNQGSYGLDGTLLVVVKNISDPSVSVKDADGFTPEGLPYYTFTASNGKLDPTQVTDEQTLVFKNPNGVQFSYELMVLAEINAAPVIKSQPELEVIGGKNYQYQIQAEDLNGDSLSYKLLSAPSGMAIDPSTGLVSWNTSAGEIGNYQLVVEVSDERGGIVQQNYNLAVITPPPNRPPVFTSNPLVDANINSEYKYQATAKDLDGDVLTFSLVNKPIGMVIDASTGVIKWTPDAQQFGNYDVTVKVDDGKGAVANQIYKIAVANAVGNSVPIITSTPITEFGILGTTNGAATANLQTIIRDFRMSGTPNGHPDFQRFLGSVTGMVSNTLGSDGLPVFIKPDGVGATSAATFAQWYRDVPGVNQRVDVPLTLTETTPGSGIWQYQNGTFFPIDNLGYGNQGFSRNFAFTVETHTNFTYKGGEVFNFTGDDDVWVFIDKKLVIDLGGTHSPLSASVALDTLGLTKGKTYAFDFFSAERYTDGSSLRLQTSIDFGSEYFYQIKASDVDSASLKYELVQAPTGMQIDPSGLISWRPKLSQQTTYPIVIKVTDPQGGVATQSFDLKVVPSNPGEIRGTVYRDANGNATKNIDEIGLQGRTVYIDENLDGRRNLDEVSTTTDVNGSYIFKTLPSGAYKIALENQSGWNITGGTGAVILGNGQILNNLNIGLLEAKDPSQNQNPYIVSTLPNSQIEADKVFKYQVKAQDPDGDGLNYSLVNSTFSGIDIDPSTGLITWQPNQAQIGRTFDSLIQVKDAYGGIAQQSIQLKVVATNTAPIFTNAPLNSIVATVNNPVEYQFRAIDADNDPIGYRIVNPTNALGATINAQTGVFAWATASRSLGSYSFTVGATDSKGLETLQDFTVALQNLPNLVPVIASTPRKQTPVGQTYVYQITATDPNSDPLTYNLINPPAGMSVNNRGLLTWTPTAAQLGQSSIQIQVSDGRGGVTSQQFDLDVVNFGNLVNNSPEITSIPTFTTNLGKTYSYQLTGTDSDNDTLIWSLDNAPTGMVIDSATGILKWNPTSSQIGNQTIAVRLSDAYGLYVGQEYTLKVNGVNTPPQIQSSPNTIAGINSPYKYQIKAVDLEGDAIQYTLGRRPTGMAVDPNTGLITWTPTATQTGTQIIDVLVTDTQGAVTTQTYNLVVGTTPINQAPTITSIPKFTADTNSQYKYQVVGTDPENSQITYALITAPTGMVIDANTGLITWDNPTLGNTNIKITATDISGAVAVQEYTLTGKQNRAPVINSTPINRVTLGNTYRYDVKATDSDNDALTYSLDNASLVAGVTIDKLGRMTWKPTTVNLGIKPVTVTVTDTNGATVTQTYNLEVLADNIAPTINLVRGTNIADIGETISFQVQATDNVGIKSKQLVIDSQTISLDANGVGTYTVTTAGVVTATAIVTDVNGNVSTASTTTNIIDPSDIEAPAINLDLSGIVDGMITGRTDIKGTVTDTNLDYYTLEVARLGSDNWQEVFRGTNSITNGTLGKFDPSLLENDTYRVRLTAYDTSGRGSQVEDEIDVTGELKLGNFRLSFTDLTIPVTGIPISLTRTYDSLTSGTTDDFGYGWRMEFRDTDLRTSLKKDEFYEQLDYRTVGFEFGTRIYITLPGGKREGFTFSPLNVQGALGGFTGGRLLYPNFVADKGVTSTLTVPGAEVRAYTSEFSSKDGTSGNVNGILMEKEGKIFNLAGRPYVPQDDGFGNRYLLTTKDGTVYEINATTGDLETVRDTNGNVLTYSDTAIVSSTGVQVTFERDNQGRITSVTDPLGQKVVYAYDAKGDLVSVKDRDGNTTQFGYNSSRAHYLDKIVDPLGREAVKTEYDENGRLKKTANSSGNGVEFVYDPNNSIEIVKDALGNPTTFEYDKRGNIVTEVDAVGKVTKRAYDDDNRMLSETVISDRSGVNGFTTTYTYDRQRNKLSETDTLGNTTYYTYGERSRLLTTTDALGRTTTNVYDANGNLTSIKDALGNITTFTYDGKGQVTQTIDAQANTTLFQYDSNGNVSKVVDPLGYIVNYTYNGRGDKLTETKLVTTAAGLQTSITTSVYDANGKMTSMTDALGQTSTYEYDKLGKQIAVTDALGRNTQSLYNSKGELIEIIYPDDTPLDLTNNPRTKTEYDADGRVAAAIDKLGRITRTVYDAVGRVIESIAPDSTLNDLTDNPRTKTEYYTDGKVKASIDERGNRTEYRYDRAGRQTDVIYADGTPLDLTDNPRTHYQYNQAGQQVSVTDALNHTTRYQYDNLGRAIKIIYADDTFTTTTYDSLGHRLTASDQNGKVTEYRYDAVGKLTGVKNALGDWTNYVYTQEGSLLSITDANNHSTTYEYDILGRRAATILPLNQRSTTNYNAVGSISTMTDFNGKTTTYKYDEQNRLVEQDFTNAPTITMTYTVGGQIATITDGRGVTSFSYDLRDRLISKTDVDGSKISYTYDLAGNRTSVTTQVINGNANTTTYTFDERNRLDKVLSGGVVLTDYNYDAMSNLVKTTLSNGVIETRQYDKLNHLLNLQTNKGSNIFTNFVYSLDKVGNRQQVVETVGSNTRMVGYVYDDLYRLTKEQVTDGVNGNRTTEFIYDKVGNRQQQQVTANNVITATTYQYDANDRLLKEQVNGNDKVIYTYDNNGNNFTKTEDGKTTESIWNDQNRLVGVKVKDGAGVITQQVSYEYDASGIRVSQNVDGEIIKYLIDANLPYAQAVVEYRPSGLVVVSYTHGNDLISQTRDGVNSFYHVDGLGSTRGLSDAEGNLIDTYSYQAFGELLNSSGGSENKYLFTGEQFDPVLRDYYNRARYYDPETGRFTRRDSYEGQIQDPISLHKYLYANGNPISNIDPSGLSTIAEQGIVTALLSFLAAFAIVNLTSNIIQENQSKNDEPKDTIYRGTTFYDVLETVASQHIDIERILLNQTRFDLTGDRAGVYFTNQILTAEYYANLVGFSGGQPRAGGPAILGAIHSRKRFQLFTLKYRIAVNAPIPQPPQPGQTETLIPYNAIPEFETFTNYIQV